MILGWNLILAPVAKTTHVKRMMAAALNVDSKLDFAPQVFHVQTVMEMEWQKSLRILTDGLFGMIRLIVTQACMFSFSILKKRP